MFVPVYTDRKLSHTPWVTYAIIFVNTAIFIWLGREILGLDQFLRHPLGARTPYQLILTQFPVFGYYLQPPMGQGFVYLQLLTYPFLHANWEHLIGNMIFFFVFAPSVEDRLGKFWFLIFYIAGGAVAGGGQMLEFQGMAPILGASGCVAAVTGAYLALAPRSYVTIAYWFLKVRTFEVTSFLVIGLKIAEDFVFQITGIDGVARLAHLAGYVFGFLIAMGLLHFRFLAPEDCDMLTWLRRRREGIPFRRVAKRGGAWEDRRRQRLSRETLETTLAGASAGQLEDAIHDAMADGKMETALAGYRALLGADPEAVLGAEDQFIMAREGLEKVSWVKAAAAYEGYLRAYPQGRDFARSQLRLAQIYVQYLNRFERAWEILQSLEQTLTEAEQIELAQSLREQIKGFFKG